VIDDPLTAREVEILQLIADGCTSINELSSRLSIRPATVKNYLSRTYAKLDATDRTQAVLRALRLGIIVLHETERV
jgi:DNA-binding NarL/FixJ family response regulator